MHLLRLIEPRKNKLRANRIEVVGDEVRIYVRENIYAIVDPADYDLVKGFKWSLKKGYHPRMRRMGKSEYNRRKRLGTLPIPERRLSVATNVRLIDGTRTDLYLHRLVPGLNFGKYFVRFRDADHLNCRAENLEILDFEYGMKMRKNSMSGEKVKRLFMILYERNRDRRKQGLLKRIEMYEQPCDENGNLLDEEAERRDLDYFGVKYVKPCLWGHDKIAAARERMYERLREDTHREEGYIDRMKRLKEERAKEDEDKAKAIQIVDF